MKAKPGDWLVHDNNALFVMTGDYFVSHYERAADEVGAVDPLASPAGYRATIAAAAKDH
ncbi:hypothetical protein [Methylocystis parvus]|uniref:hypothetical protein n=1 Tax=Methylocystis parvus TaxID=134 RepID=UPI000304C618|nr:hypothetical protein [Methylocystis parvus]WBK00814.1 hypothetical protein MMG94_03550 [Methylocystis parvus OBBP]